MNILVICHYGLYQKPESSFVHNQVKEYVNLGHRVRVIVPVAVGKSAWDLGKLSSAPYCLDGVDIHPIRYLSVSNYGKPWFNTFMAVNAIRFNLRKLLKNFSVDVIHAHTIGFDSEIGAYFKKITRAPLIVTTHGSDTTIPIEKGQIDRMKAFCDVADTIVAVSTSLANILRRCKTQVPISVILNGFAISKLTSCTDRLPFSFIQVGYLQSQKRIDVTLEAFAQIKKDYPQSILTIIGEGPQREELEMLCRKLEITGAVRFLGKVSNREVLKEMSRHQFFVMPSVNEGFGIVYLEAMASGCITIGTENEGISDLIVNGVNGFLVPPDNPEAISKVIVWCVKNTEEANDIAKRGQMEAMNLTWEKNARQMIKVMQSIMVSGSSFR